MVQTLWDSITEFLANGDKRTAALQEGIRENVTPFVPPNLREPLGLLAEMNPVQDIYRAGGNVRGGNYVNAGVDTAIAAAPVVGGILGRVGAKQVADTGGDLARAVMDTLLGGAPGRSSSAVDTFAERMNQPGPVPTMYSNPIMRAADDGFDVSRRDASSIFGEGSERVRYTDPKSGGTIEVVVRPDGGASVLELEVPEASRGKGIGQSLQQRVMRDFPKMGGQVSSKAAAKTAYKLGRRPYGQPDATLDDVFAAIDDMSSINLVSPQMQPTPAQEVARLLREGRADEVTDEMLAKFTPNDEMEIFDLYQRGATGMDLPMDEASRMARAREMGHDTRGFHGTDETFPAFSENPVYMSGSPDVAFTYVRGDGQILPLTMRNQENVAEFDVAGGYFSTISPEMQSPNSNLPMPQGYATGVENPDIGENFFRTQDIERLAALEGLSGADYKNVIDRGPSIFKPFLIKQDQALGTSEAAEFAARTAEPSTVNMRLYPNQVRSQFARFDPRLKHLRNLSAGIAGGGLLATQNDQQQREDEIRQYLGGLL